MQLYYTKLMKVMKEGIYIAEYYHVLFFLGDHVYFEILCTMTTVTQWKVLKQGVHCILLLIDIFDLLWKGYKLKEYAAIMGGRYW
jgi:hypothetical protein